MSDLVLSLEAAKQGKRIMLLKHPAQYFKLQDIDHSKSIYVTENKREQKQIEMANEILRLKQ